VLWSISRNLALLLLVYSVVGTTLIVFRQSQTGVAELTSNSSWRLIFRYGLVHIRKQRRVDRLLPGEQQEGSEAGRRLNGANRQLRPPDHLGSDDPGDSSVSYDYFSRFLPWAG